MAPFSLTLLLPPEVALQRPEDGVPEEGPTPVAVDQFTTPVFVVVRITVPRDVVERVGPDEEVCQGEGPLLWWDVSGPELGPAQGIGPDMGQEDQYCRHHRYYVHPHTSSICQEKGNSL